MKSPSCGWRVTKSPSCGRRVIEAVPERRSRGERRSPRAVVGEWSRQSPSILIILIIIQNTGVDLNKHIHRKVKCAHLVPELGSR